MPENKKELMLYRLNSAKERLDSSKMLLDNGNLKDSVNRSYYADFFIVSQADAEEQYLKAKEFFEVIKKYLEDKV